MKGSDGKVSDALKMIVAPEIKRRIIGDTFIHVTEEVRTHTIHTIPYHTIPYHTIPYHTVCAILSIGGCKMGIR
jgi:hypothetical protein